MNIKSIVLKLLGLVSLATVGFAIWFLIHFVIPSGFQSRDGEGPIVLTELLAMAEESQPFNSDPYISSTYRLGDALYEPLLAIQRNRWDIAEELLLPLVKENNPEAMFWLAQINYRTGIYAGPRAAELFKRSAELGNPYAALRLDVDDHDCQRYMRGYCNEKWGKLGRKILKERAEQGDLKAKYALFDFDEFSDKDTHLELERLVTENAKKYYYRPLMDMVELYQQKWYYPYLSEDEELSLEDKLILNKLKSLMINNNYTVAYHWYDDSVNNIYQRLDDVVKKYIYIDSSLSLCSSYFPRKKNVRREEIILSAGCARADAIISGGESDERHRFDVFIYVLKKANHPMLNDDEMQQANEIAQEIIQNAKPMIYIDELHPEP